MSDEFNARWAGLMAAIRSQATARGVDPRAVHDHREDCRVSLPLEGTEYFVHTFKKSEVLHEDAAGLADKLYADYEAHRTHLAAG